MGGWNYRIIRKKVGEAYQYGIHEAYCDINGKVWAITENPLDVVAFKEWAETDQDTPEAMIKQTLEWMMKACDKPILDWENIPEDGAISPDSRDD